MEIKTQFDIHNLVQRKFDTGSKSVTTLLEVMDIKTETCIAGTQVFYATRPISIVKEYNDKWNDEKGFELRVMHGFTNEKLNTLTNLPIYREDELITAKQEYIDIILGNNK